METKNSVNIEIIWDAPEIDLNIKLLAERIADNWKDADTVNLVPIMTGAISFGAKLLNYLEKKLPN